MELKGSGSPLMDPDEWISVASQESFVADSSRWRVKLSSGAMKDLKAENLRLMDLQESQASQGALAQTSNNQHGST